MSGWGDWGNKPEEESAPSPRPYLDDRRTGFSWLAFILGVVAGTLLPWVTEFIWQHLFHH
jgi:hypothetical protein